MTDKFWDKVMTCKHEHHTDYRYWGYCSTPYCGTWSEYHCKDCGVYISDCLCMSNDGMSGWSSLRWKNYDKKRYP